MALTQGHAIYAALHQNGIRKFLHNVFLARPHYFTYATPALGGGSDDVSSIPPLRVPGSGAGIDFSFQFTEPDIGFFPVASPPFPLPVNNNQFGLYTKATVCIVATSQSLLLQVAHRLKGKAVKAQSPQLICGSLEIWAVGEPTVHDSGQDKLISLWVDTVQVKGTGNLDPLVQYIGLQMLNVLLGKLQLSANSMAQGAFKILVEKGPEISDNALKVWAGLV